MYVCIVHVLRSLITWLPNMAFLCFSSKSLELCTCTCLCKRDAASWLLCSSLSLIHAVSSDDLQFMHCLLLVSTSSIRNSEWVGSSQMLVNNLHYLRCEYDTPVHVHTRMHTHIFRLCHRFCWLMRTVYKTVLL